jgi:hypothetical protein
VKDRVHRGKHAGGTGSLGSVSPAEGARANKLAYECAVQSGRYAFARYVADRHSKTVRLGRQVVVKIAPQLARRNEYGRNIDAFETFG